MADSAPPPKRPRGRPRKVTPNATVASVNGLTEVMIALNSPAKLATYFAELIIEELTAEWGVVTQRDNRLITSADAVRASLFRQQLAVLLDPARRKTALCPRRAGKSWTAMSAAFDTCLRTPRAQVVICTLTMRHAKNIYWDEMQAYAAQFGIEVQPHKQDMTLTFTNGSKIMMVGAESSAEIEKLRGGKYNGVIIDECKSYAARIMKELIDDVVWPALGDKLGWLLLVGTPGNILKGYFYETTYPGYKRKGKYRPDWMVAQDYAAPEPYWATATHEPLWSRHHWSRQDNTALPHLWQESLDTKLANGWDDSNPTWRREHLGEWVASESTFVYAYAHLSISNPALVTWEPAETAVTPHGLPDASDWSYVMGLDLGYEDDYAIVVIAYSPSQKAAYHVFDFKENHKDIFEIADKIEQIYRKFNGQFTAMVADATGIGQLVVETLNKRFGFQFQPADKRHKFDHVELINADFRTGRVRIIPGSSLDFELQTLQWNVGEDEDVGDLAARNKLKEVASLPNHLCDAFLYAWRFCYHHWSAPAMTVAMPGTAEWHAEHRMQAITNLLNKRGSSASNWLAAACRDDVDITGGD